MRRPPPLGLFTTDTRLHIRTWDEWLTQVTGLSSKEVIGKPLSFIVPDLEQKGLLTRFQRVLEAGVTEVLSPALHRFLIPCPPTFPSIFYEKMQQKVTLTPLREGDQISGVLVAVEDVTARLEEERRLAEDLAGPDETKRLAAARLLAEREEGAEGLLGAISDESWRIRRTAVRGLVEHGGTEAVLSLIRTIRQEHRDPGALNSALKVLSLSDIDIFPSLVELLKESDPELRLYAAQALGDKADPRAVPILISLLKDEDFNVRFQAVEGLGMAGAQEAVEPLMALVESRDFFLAFPALEALSRIGDGRLIRRIIPLLEDELLQDPAAGLIARLGDEEAVPDLMAFLNGHPRAVIRVARALAGIYERYESRFGEGRHIRELVAKAVQPSAIRNLLDALPKVEKEDLRPLALVLGWLEGPAVERALTRLIGNPEINREVVEALVRHGSRVTDLLIEQLNSEDLEVRQAAVIALGRIGDARSVPALIEVLTRDPELTVVTAGALAKIGDRRAFEGLIELLGDPQAVVRQAVISALNSIAHPEMEGRIGRLLQDADPRIRESAARIAGYFGYPSAVERLLEMSRDPVEEVRRAVIEHLPYLEDERALETVLKALKEDTPRVRASAAKALALSLAESPLVRFRLVEALQDEDPWVRYYAVRSLSRLQEEGPTEAFIALLNSDPAPQVRIAVLESLGLMGGDKALEVLTAYSQSEEYDLARASIRSLGQSKHPSSLSVLMKALKTEDPDRKMDVIYALGKKGGEGVAETLQWTAAMEKEERVARAAVEALALLESPEGVGALIHLSADPRLREECLAALAKIREEHIPWLEQGLDHPQSRTRQAVIEVLVRIKRPQATSLIIRKALKDPDPAVRLAAVTALDYLGSPVALRELARLAQSDEDFRVRQAAAKAVGN